MTNRFNPIVFHYHGTARALTRLAARPQAGTYRDGYYFISGSGSGAVIYIYSNLFSTYSVATSGTKSYTVFFDPNGGTVSQTSAQTDANGKLANLLTPTRSGYTFNGWYDALTGGNSVTKDTAFTADSTIYARWTPAGGNNNSAPVYSGSSGSSSDSDDTRYKVTAGEAQHGTVSVSSSSTSSGTKVTITVKPDTGYA